MAHALIPNSGGSSSFLTSPVIVCFPGHSHFSEDKMVAFSFLVTKDVECSFTCSLALGKIFKFCAYF